MKRHNDALMIQQGASNPSGIAYSIIEACQELREQPGFKGQLSTDPAIRLMVHQLAVVCRIIDLPGHVHADLTLACRKQVQ